MRHNSAPATLQRINSVRLEQVIGKQELQKYDVAMLRVFAGVGGALLEAVYRAEHPLTPEEECHATRRRFQGGDHQPAAIQQLEAHISQEGS